MLFSFRIKFDMQFKHVLRFSQEKWCSDMASNGRTKLDIFHIRYFPGEFFAIFRHRHSRFLNGSEMKCLILLELSILSESARFRFKYEILAGFLQTMSDMLNFRKVPAKNYGTSSLVSVTISAKWLVERRGGGTNTMVMVRHLNHIALAYFAF